MDYKCFVKEIYEPYYDDVSLDDERLSINGLSKISDIFLSSDDSEG